MISIKPHILGNIASVLRANAIRLKKIEEYDKNPKFCLTCGSKITFEKRECKFCNQSCSAKFNNSKRIVTEEQKNKTSKALIGKKHTNRKNYRKPKLYEHVCKICGKISYLNWKQKNRKTCSRECMIYACVKTRPYQNGSRKTCWYYNKNTKKKELLESSWELEIAKLLDSKNIEWYRPSPISWIDSEKKTHLYFPDFYLPKYHLYLDPKNPYCMERDKEKLEIVSAKINLKYGNLDSIKKQIYLLE